MEKFPYISMVNFKISLVENQCLPFRSSRSQMFFKVGVLKSYAIFTGKHLRWSLFLIKFKSFRPAWNFIKKKLEHRYFPVNIAKILRTAFFIEHFRWLLLPFTTTFQNYYWNDRWITVNKDHVHGTPEKHLEKVLDMLQVVNKEKQFLLLTFSIFHVLF